MPIYSRKEKRVFKEGEKYHLDSVYDILGLFPHDGDEPFFQQDDIGDLARYSSKKSRDGSDNDCGEYVKILRNFSISIEVRIK